MEAIDVLSQIGLGALLGLMRQGIRVVIGLKKHGDEAAAPVDKLLDRLDLARLGLSLAMGTMNFTRQSSVRDK
jgi:hypothetical protein